MLFQLQTFYSRSEVAEMGGGGGTVFYSSTEWFLVQKVLKCLQVKDSFVITFFNLFLVKTF